MKNINIINASTVGRRNAICRKCKERFKIGDTTIHISSRTKQKKWYHLKCYENMGY